MMTHIAEIETAEALLTIQLGWTAGGEIVADGLENYHVVALGAFMFAQDAFGVCTTHTA